MTAYPAYSRHPPTRPKWKTAARKSARTGRPSSVKFVAQLDLGSDARSRTGRPRVDAIPSIASRTANPALRPVSASAATSLIVRCSGRSRRTPTSLLDIQKRSMNRRVSTSGGPKPCRLNLPLPCGDQHTHQHRQQQRHRIRRGQTSRADQQHGPDDNRNRLTTDCLPISRATAAASHGRTRADGSRAKHA